MVKINKAFSFLVLGVMLILMLVAVSAQTEESTTIIAGKIYNADYTAVESGAFVKVTCGNNFLTTTSLPDGAYKVKFDESTGLCNVDDTLTVYASKGSLTGMKTGIVKAEGDCPNPSPDSENCLIHVYTGLDVAVVNVPLVPEFGTVVGVLTALGAVGVFFVVRRK